MKSGTPTWVIFTSVFLMLIGGCGLKNDIQSIGIRDSIAKAKVMFDRTTESIKSDSSGMAAVPADTTAVADSLTAKTDSIGSRKEQEAFQAFDRFKKMLDISESTIELIIMLGYIGLFFSVLLILAGLSLLLKKKFSIMFAYIALVLTLVFSLVKWYMLSGENNTLLTVGTGISAAFTFIICTVFLIIIFSSDKSYLEDSLPEI